MNCFLDNVYLEAFVAYFERHATIKAVIVAEMEAFFSVTRESPARKKVNSVVSCWNLFTELILFSYIAGIRGFVYSACFAMQFCAGFAQQVNQELY